MGCLCAHAPPPSAPCLRPRPHGVLSPIPTPPRCVWCMQEHYASGCRCMLRFSVEPCLGLGGLGLGLGTGPGAMSLLARCDACRALHVVL